MFQEQILQTVNLLPGRPLFRQDHLLDLDIDQKLTLLRQELKADMAYSLKAVLAEAMNPMASKAPLRVVDSPELIEWSVQQALEKNREISSIKSQLSR